MRMVVMMSRWMGAARDGGEDGVFESGVLAQDLGRQGCGFRGFVCNRVYILFPGSAVMGFAHMGMFGRKQMWPSSQKKKKKNSGNGIQPLDGTRWSSPKKK